MIEEQQLPLPHGPSDLSHILPELRPLARPMAELIPDPENARKHDLRNLKMIAESLMRFGQCTPLKVNKKTGYIEKGNGTYMAAKMLGWTMIAWVWSDLERQDALAYGLIDNRTSDTSTTDYGQTGATLRELQAADYPMFQFWTEEEAMPLLRSEFQKAEISDEKFDPGLQRGRAIVKISASERISVDKAVAFIRSKSKRSVTEGTALAQICEEFIALHVNEFDNAVNEELEVMALSLEDDEDI